MKQRIKLFFKGMYESYLIDKRCNLQYKQRLLDIKVYYITKKIMKLQGRYDDV